MYTLVTKIYIIFHYLFVAFVFNAFTNNIKYIL